MMVLKIVTLALLEFQQMILFSYYSETRDQ